MANSAGIDYSLRTENWEIRSAEATLIAHVRSYTYDMLKLHLVLLIQIYFCTKGLTHLKPVKILGSN